MNEAKTVITPIAQHFKLSVDNSPKEIDIEHKRLMSTISYSQAVGSLMHVMISTRPYKAYATSLVSRYMANPGKRHWEATKWILRYLKGTKDARLLYQQSINSKPELFGFVDSDYAGDLDKRR